MIPAYNEAARLPSTLQAIAAYWRGRSESCEVWIVDDGSSDGTAGLCPPAPPPGLTWRRLRNHGNRGKGYSVRRGMLAAQGELRLFTDADLSAPITELRKLETAIASGADIALGSRAQRDLISRHQSPMREVAGRVFNRIVRRALTLPFADTQCGFKLFTAACAEAVFARQTVAGWCFDPEVLYLARRLGYRATEVPVAWAHADGAKLRLVGDSLRMLASVAVIRHTHRQPRRESRAA